MSYFFSYMLFAMREEDTQVKHCHRQCLGQYQQYCLDFRFSCVGKMHLFFPSEQGCQTITLNSTISDCIVNISLLWFAGDVCKH